MDVVTVTVVIHRNVVLLTSHEAIREAFVERSVDFADRPALYLNQLLCPDNKGTI